MGPGWGSAQTPLPPGQSVAMGPSAVRLGNPIGGSGSSRDLVDMDMPVGQLKKGWGWQSQQKGSSLRKEGLLLRHPQLSSTPGSLMVPTQGLHSFWGTILNVLSLAAFFTGLHAQYTHMIWKTNTLSSSGHWAARIEDALLWMLISDVSLHFSL